MGGHHAGTALGFGGRRTVCGRLPSLPLYGHPSVPVPPNLLLGTAGPRQPRSRHADGRHRPVRAERKRRGDAHRQGHE